MDLDFSDPSFVRDPYPALARLRTRAEVSWHEPTGRWLAASHAAAGAVLRHRRLGRFWQDREPAARWEPFNLLHRNQMMENEPPAHTRLRSQVAYAFARGHVSRLRPAIAAEAARLLADAGPSFDLLADLAEPLAVTVIAELLGVPPADRHRLRPWSAAIVRMYEVAPTAGLSATSEGPGARSGTAPEEPGFPAPSVGPSAGSSAAAEEEEEALAACREFADYLRDLAARRTASPADDLISHLVAARLSADEVVASAALLLNAGHEASVNALGGGVVALLRHPDQLARLRGDRSLVPTAVEEMIRYDPPLHLFARTAASPVDIAGVTIPEGGEIAALLGAANRDPAVFTDPDTFDVGRDPNPHLGFGAGLHFCLGAPLARLELQAALTALLDHAPRLALAAEPAQRPTFVLRAYIAVHLVT